MRDPIVLEAMRSVPREAFPTAAGIPPPTAIGRVLEALELRPQDRVLKVGTGSGWTASVLGRLAAEVWAVERDSAAAELARDCIEKLGIGNVRVITGEMTCDEVGRHAPYDAILVSSPVESVPDGLMARLRPGGRLVAIVDGKTARRRLRRIRVQEDGARLTDDLGESRGTPLLADILVATGRVSRSAVEAAAAEAATRGVDLETFLVASGACEEADVYRALARQHELKFANATEILALVDPAVVPKYPRKFLDHHQVVPVREHDGEILVATPDPALSVLEVAQAFGIRRVSVRIVTPTDYRRVWTAIELGHVTGAKRAAAAAAPAADGWDSLPLEASRASASFDAMVQDAVAERASDLHLECYEGCVRVRFRVDGSLRDVDRYGLGPNDLVALVNVIKIAARLDIAERRVPQGGRLRRRYGDRAYDMRVQTQPSLMGEHVVIRILPQEVRIARIEDLGFPQVLADHYRRFLRSPHGMVLVVGPTGSGKSTTLYAGIRLLSEDPSRKVITVEDPIEHAIHGVQQTQANPVIGWRFADAMRAFVREDPDVVFVGEIRDPETAIEAIRASQTGHLVLSTLHCNDAVDAMQRLLDLGMHPNSVGSELTAVFSQRLARRICNSCRQPATPDAALMAELFPNGVPEGFRCFTGAGCEHCGRHGTHGRVAVVEFLPVSPAIRKAVSRREALDDLRELARGTGLVSLRTSCLQLIQDGVIPLTEMHDVLTAEQIGEAR